MLLHLGDHDVRAEHEHAAVPVIAALGEIGFCGFEVRLLDKSLDAISTRDAERLALFYIAIRRLRRSGSHTEGHDVSLGANLRGGGNGARERSAIAHDMIGR